MALTERQKRFAFEYVKDFNGVRAAIRATYAEAGAGDTAYKLLKNNEVLEEIEMWKDVNCAAARITPEWVLNQWAMIAIADPSDIVSLQVRSCPACYDQAARDLMIAHRLEHTLRVPNPDCKECEGKGCPDVKITATADLKGPARRLYAGAYKTKDGIKILFRDQDGALKSIANYLGMEKNDQRIQAVVENLTKPAKQMTDEELNALASAGPLPELDGGTPGGTPTQP